MAKSSIHLHKYRRMKFDTGKILYKCMLPGCTHSIVRKLLRGREFQCWKCGEPGVVGKRQMRQALLRCDACSTSSLPDISIVTELLGE